MRSYGMTTCVIGFEIISRLHFNQPGNCSIKFESFNSRRIWVELGGISGCRGKEFDPLIIERIDQMNKAFGFIALVSCQHGNMINKQGVKGVGDRQIIGRAERRFTKLRE